jgi:hypothetical protein
MADGTVSVELTLEEQQALKAITALTKKFEEFGGKVESTVKKSDMAWGSFVGNLAANAATKAVGLLTDGIQYLTGSISDAVKASAEEAKALQVLNVSLAQTGQYSDKASKSFKELASEIETTTGIQSEAVYETAAYIQQINKLSNKDLEAVTRATVDFAAAMQLDLGTASGYVSKALAGNEKALRKFGITLTDGANSGQRFTEVMAALSRQQGAAEAQTKTFAGGWQLLQTNIGNFQKSIGFLITENPAVIAALKGLSNGVAFLASIIEKNKTAINDFITNGVLKLVDSLKFLSSIAATFNTGLAMWEVGFNFLAKAVLTTQNAILKSGIALNEFNMAAKEFVGIDPSEGQKKWVEENKRIVETNNMVKESIDAESKAIMSRTNTQNAAMKTFSAVVIEGTKAAIEEQKKIVESGSDEYLMALNAKGAATVKIEKDTIDAVALLRETQRGLDLQKIEENKLLQQLYAEENFQFLADNLGREEALREVARAEELQKTAGTNAAKLSLQAAYIKAQQGQLMYFRKWEEQTNKEKLASTKETLGQIAGLMQSSNSQFFEIGKAAAVTNATIDGYMAVQKTLASLPYPFNIAAAALVGAQAAMNVSKIASQKPPKFADGGFVGGNSFSGDKVTAQVNSGEAVLNASQQREFMKIANGGGSGNNNGILEAINSLGNKIANMTIVVQADGREIARLVRDQKAMGFA